MEVVAVVEKGRRNLVVEALLRLAYLSVIIII